MRFNPDRLAATVAWQGGLMAPLLLVAAVFCGQYAAGSVKEVVSVLTSQSTSQGSQASIKLEKTQISEAQAKASALRLAKLSPAVRVAVSGKSVVVSAKSPEQFAEFMHALSLLQSTTSDVAWDADEICIGKCTGGAAAYARATGYKQSIKHTSPN